MNQGAFLRIVRAPIWAKNMLWFGKRNYRAKVKHNKSGKLKSLMARILKHHGTCDRKVLNYLKPLTRFYLLNPLIIICVSWKFTDPRCVNRLFTQTFVSSEAK